MDLLSYQRTVFGFHGCDKHVADAALLSQHPRKKSRTSSIAHVYLFRALWKLCSLDCTLSGFSIGLPRRQEIRSNR